MHYIGSKMYGIKRFINESKRMGVQRVIPFRMLKNIQWGQPILCAEYQPVEENILVAQMDDLKLNAVVKKPVASLFGYFNVNSISYSKLPDNIRAKIFEKLDVISFKDLEVDNNMIDEERSCGQYSIGGVATVTNTFEEIIDAIKQVCEDEKINPNDYKYFLKGDFTQFNKPKILYGRKFSRGYSKVQIEDFDIKEIEAEKTMFFLADYEKRKYLRKGDKDRLDRVVEDENMEKMY